MSILDQKKAIFGNISALNVLNDNYPSLPNSNSFSSINNGTNSTDFLLDLVTSLVGYTALQEFLVDTITYGLDDIEEAVKDAIKDELTQMVSCSVNPNIPQWVRSNQPGVTIPVQDLDFFNILKVPPNTDAGTLVYSNESVIAPFTRTVEITSGDFNHFLHDVLQYPSNNFNWGTQTGTESVMTVNFTEIGVGLPASTVNNTITFTTSPGYSDKKLTEFNNAFVDSVGLFGAPTSSSPQRMINLLSDDMFGSITSSQEVNKSEDQIVRELEIREIIDCMINNDSDIVDDSFFTFDNATVTRINEEARDRKNGIRRVKTCGNLAISIPQDVLLANQSALETATTKEEERSAVNTALNNLATIQASFSPNPQDENTVKTEFFMTLVRQLTNTMVTTIINPNFASLISINNQIIFGQNTMHNGGVDFLKKNKKLIKNIINVISGFLIAALLKLALKELTKKVRDKVVGDSIERSKNRLKILASYAGVSSITDQLNNI